MYAFALALSLLVPAADAFNPLPAILPEARTDYPLRDYFWPLPMPGDEDVLAFVVSKPLTGGFAGSVDGSPLQHHEAMTIYNAAPREGDRLRFNSSLVTNIATMSGKSKVRDPDIARDDPTGRGHSWYNEESLRMPLSETLFAYG